jgi:hypothetical protein
MAAISATSRDKTDRLIFIVGILSKALMLPFRYIRMDDCCQSWTFWRFSREFFRLEEDEYSCLYAQGCPVAGIGM